MSPPTLEQQWATLPFGAVQVETRSVQHVFEVEVYHDND